MNGIGADRGSAEEVFLPITCPLCGGTCRVVDTVDACAFFHECDCCGALLRPVTGDCCVICSYGGIGRSCSALRSGRRF